MAHLLTNKDKAALTATCSACGPDSPIAKNGRYGFVCREGRREARRRYRAAHPDRTRRASSTTSEHRLTTRDGSADTCRICGPVTPVAMGRGWGCPNRAKELGWKVFASEPQPSCPICRTFLDRFGGCAKCDDDLSDLEAAWLPKESRTKRRMFDVASHYYKDGYMLTSGERPIPEYESAVPGWKVLGSASSGEHQVRSDYAALYGSGSKRDRV